VAEAWYTGMGAIVLAISIIASVISLWMSFEIARRSKKTVQDYVLAGGTLGIVVLYFYGAFTIMSAWTFYGLSGWFYRYGHGIMIPWYMFIHLFQVAIITWLGIKLWGGAKYYGFPTPLAIYADRLESRAVRVVAAVANLIFLIPYLALQFPAIAFGLNALVGAPYEFGFFYAAVIGALIAFIGGMRAVAYTNVLWGAIFLIAFVGTFALALASLPKPFSDVTQEVLAKSSWLFSNPDPFGPLKLTGADRFAYAMGYILSGISGCLWIHLMYIPMTLRSPLAMKWYPTLQFVSFSLIFTLMAGLIGTTVGYTLAPKLANPDQVFQVIATQCGGPWWGAFVWVGAFAAAVSTIGTMIVAGASLFSIDLVRTFKKEVDERKLLWWTRGFLWLVVAVSTIFGWLATMGWRYIGLPAPIPLADFLSYVASPGFALNIVLLIALYWKRATKVATIVSYIVGVVLLLIGYLYPPFTYVLTGLRGLPALAIALPVELVLFFALSYATKPASEKAIEKWFDQLNKYLYESPDPQVEGLKAS